MKTQTFTACKALFLAALLCLSLSVEAQAKQKQWLPSNFKSGSVQTASKFG